MKARVTEICQALEQKSLEYYHTDKLAQSIFSSEEDYIQRQIKDPDFTRQRYTVAFIIALAEQKEANIKKEIKAYVFEAVQDGLFDVWYDVLESVNESCKELGLPFKINDKYQPVSTEVEIKQV